MPAISGDAEFAAGFAWRDITPGRAALNYKGARLDVPSEAHPPLECQAAVFCNHQMCVAVLVIDTTAVGRDTVLRLREHAALDPRTKMIDHLSVIATHTHCAMPLAPMFLAGGLPDALYVDRVVSRAVEALAEAVDARQPARFAAGIATTPGLEYNRRLLRPDGRIAMALADDLERAARPAGPVDTDVPFWLFTDQAGRPIGTILSYACHNNAARTACFSADIAGYARRKIRGALGSGVTPVIVPGASGDVTWMDPFGPRTGGIDVAERHGCALANKLLEATDAAQPSVVASLRSAHRTHLVPDRAFEASDFDDDGSRGTAEDIRAAHQKRYEPERAAVKQRGDSSAIVELGVVAIDDSALVTNPAELFAQLGLAVRRDSPFAVTLIGELANGYVGYVPDEPAFELGGYEMKRTVYTSRLAKDAGANIVAWTQALLSETAVPCTP